MKVRNFQSYLSWTHDTHIPIIFIISHEPSNLAAFAALFGLWLPGLWLPGLATSCTLLPLPCQGTAHTSLIERNKRGGGGGGGDPEHVNSRRQRSRYMLKISCGASALTKEEFKCTGSLAYGIGVTSTAEVSLPRAKH